MPEVEAPWQLASAVISGSLPSESKIAQHPPSRQLSSAQRIAEGCQRIHQHLQFETRLQLLWLEFAQCLKAGTRWRSCRPGRGNHFATNFRPSTFRQRP